MWIDRFLDHTEAKGTPPATFKAPKAQLFSSAAPKELRLETTGWDWMVNGGWRGQSLGRG